MNIRVGIGYDAHRLAEGRKLILGGVLISYEKGLAGHSDADVLTHAVIDSLLGAAGLGDIGRHFPDTDGRYKNVSSLLLLKETYNLILSQNFLICNIDSIIIAQAPKIAPFAASMKKNFSEILRVDPEVIGIKATTEEGMGFTGAGEGIAASAVCLLYKNSGVS